MASVLGFRCTIAGAEGEILGEIGWDRTLKVALEPVQEQAPDRYVWSLGTRSLSAFPELPLFQIDSEVINVKGG